MVPLYSQIERDIVEKIHHGELAPEQALPTELELCSQYGVSRITVRRAVERLVSARMIYRRRGVGTFVSRRDASAKALKLVGYMRDVLTFDRQLATRILKRGVRSVPEPVRQAFGLESAEKLYAISALNFLDGEPYAVTHSFFTRELTAVAAKIEMRGGRTSLREIEEMTDIRVRSGEQSIEPMVARGALATQLGLKPNTAILTTTRLYYADGPKPVEVVVVHYHPARYRISVELVGADSFAQPA